MLPARKHGTSILPSYGGLYGFRTFSGRGASELKEWLFREAEMAVSNEDIARRFVAECRRTRTVLPATSTIERLCAAALVDAERRIETRIASRLPMSIREQLLALLEETADDRVTRFVWLRQFELARTLRRPTGCSTGSNICNASISPRICLPAFLPIG